MTLSKHISNFPVISRRQFLGLAGGIVAWQFLAPAINATFIANRVDKWKPASDDLVQWRYIAGRIVDGGDDYGFIVSISDIAVSGAMSQQLLVQHTTLTGTPTFSKNTYTGSRTYEAGTATYTFKDEADQTLATWRWDDTNGEYLLTVTTAELTLNNLTLKPQGDLIAEGGDGEIQVGRLQGLLIDSDYHADWVKIESGGQEKGTARVDMQGLRVASAPIVVETEYAHHWFAIAVVLNDDSQVWISAWRIEDSTDGPYWAVTIAQGSGVSWSIVRSLTEGNSANPVTVTILDWQDVPLQPLQETGSKWQLTAPDNSLDLVVSVPTGQFITTNPLSGLGGPSQIQEAIGLEVSGTVLGQGIKTVQLAVAESTAEFYRRFLPIIVK